MSKEQNNRKVYCIFTSMLCFAVIILSFTRIFLGVPVSDESYAIAESYIVSEGAIPFVNNWSQMPGFTLLLAPFVYMYTHITGTTEGIVLFTRMLCFLINAACMIVMYKMLNKRLKNRLLCILFALPFITWYKYYMVAYRGDHLGAQLTAVGTVFVICSILEHDKEKYLAAIGGVLNALAVMCYAQLIVVWAIILLLLGVDDIRDKNRFRRCISYFTASVFSGIVVVLYLILKSNLSDFIKGFSYLLSDMAYLERVGTRFRTKVHLFLVEIPYDALFFIGSSFVFSMIFWLLENRSKTQMKEKIKEKIKGTLLKGLLFGEITTILWQSAYHYHTMGGAYVTCYAFALIYAMTIIYYFFFSSRSLVSSAFFWYMCIPTGAWVLLITFSTADLITLRCVLLGNAVFASTMIVSDALKSNVEDKGQWGMLIKIFPIIYVTVISINILFCSLTTIHHDEPIPYLKQKVDKGVFKGIYTTQERCNAMIELERQMRELTSANDKILILDTVPFAYLMSEAKACTPSTWDQTLYVFEYDNRNNPQLYYDYFALTNTVPSKIIYINSKVFVNSEDEFRELSILNKEHNFNKYVHENYELTYQDEDAYYPIMVYSRKENDN